MCNNICPSIIELLVKYERETEDELRYLYREELNAVTKYVQNWSSRPCTCCFKDPKNFSRFNAVVKGFSLSVVEVLNQINTDITRLKPPKETGDGKRRNRMEREKVDRQLEEAEAPKVKSPDSKSDPKKDVPVEDWGSWSLKDKEDLIFEFSKVFRMKFPLYIAHEHSRKTRFGKTGLPPHLLKNVHFFCDNYGVNLIKNCFEDSNIEILSLSTARRMVELMSNLRVWMRTICPNLVADFRLVVRKYISGINTEINLDEEQANTMVKLLYFVVDEQYYHFEFSKERLESAFIFFVAANLQLRRFGLQEIADQARLFITFHRNNDLVKTEGDGTTLAAWLTDKRMVFLLFGSNRTPEFEDSLDIIRFLALKGRIINEQLDTIWACTEKGYAEELLKFFILLAKDLQPFSASYLFRLVKQLETKREDLKMFLLDKLEDRIFDKKKDKKSSSKKMKRQLSDDDEGEEDSGITFTKLLKGYQVESITWEDLRQSFFGASQVSGSDVGKAGPSGSSPGRSFAGGAAGPSGLIPGRSFARGSSSSGSSPDRSLAEGIGSNPVSRSSPSPPPILGEGDSSSGSSPLPSLAEGSSGSSPVRSFAEGSGSSPSKKCTTASVGTSTSSS